MKIEVGETVSIRDSNGNLLPVRVKDRYVNGDTVILLLEETQTKTLYRRMESVFLKEEKTIKITEDKY